MEYAMKTDFQRWTAKRKVDLILRIMKGETTLVDICREQDLKQSEVEGWIETFLKSAPLSTASIGKSSVGGSPAPAKPRSQRQLLRTA
jgi:transposase-like protein